MSEPGKAMMGTATASGPDRARLAAEQAVACPLLEGIDLSGARGVLVLLTASHNSLKLNESRSAVETVRKYAAPEVEVIYDAAFDDAMGDELRVTVVATGLSDANADAQRQPMAVMQGGLRTGTDNAVFAAPGAGASNFQPSDFGHLGLASPAFRASPARSATAPRPAAAPARQVGPNAMDSNYDDRDRKSVV